LWWQNIGDASSGAKTPQQAMDSLAAAQDSVMERLEKSGCRVLRTEAQPEEDGGVLVAKSRRRHIAPAKLGTRSRRAKPSTTTRLSSLAGNARSALK